jgi:tetratricopeptide (TPR) repeat protein
MRHRLSPGDHPEAATLNNNLADVLADQGQLDAAEASYRDSLAMLRRLLPGDHEFVASAHGNLGAVFQLQGKLNEAADEHRTALAIRRRIYSGDHPNLASNLNNLAAALRMGGRLGEAEPLFREALDMGRRMLPPGHPQIAATLANLAGVMRDRGDAAGAEPLVREAVTLITAALPATRAERWRLTSEHGFTLARLRRYPEAERLLLEADRGFASSANARPDWHRENAARLAQLYEQWDHADPGAGHAAGAAEWRSRAASGPPSGR